MSIDLYQNQVQQGFTSEQESLLNKRLDANQIYHRKGQGGKMLAYIKGSTAISHANEIFGYGKWGYRILRQEVRKARDLQDMVVGLFYETDVELFVLGAAFPVTGCGAASIEKPFDGVSYENARKSSVKDAVKLALVNYGDQFGLALYDGDAEVEMDGEVVRVSQVPTHESGKTVPPKRVVESGNAPLQLPSAQQNGHTEKPSEKAIHDMVGRAKLRAAKLGLVHNASEWSGLLDHLQIKEVKTVADIGKINEFLSEKEAAVK